MMGGGDPSSARPPGGNGFDYGLRTVSSAGNVMMNEAGGGGGGAVDEAAGAGAVAGGATSGGRSVPSAASATAAAKSAIFQPPSNGSYAVVADNSNKPAHTPMPHNAVAMIPGGGTGSAKMVGNACGGGLTVMMNGNALGAPQDGVYNPRNGHAAPALGGGGSVAATLENSAVSSSAMSGVRPVYPYLDAHMVTQSVVKEQQGRIEQLERDLNLSQLEIQRLKAQTRQFEADRSQQDSQHTEGKRASSRYWTAEEHQRFLEGLKMYGARDIKAISRHVRTRSATQVRTHAQKYYLRLQRESSKSAPHASVAGGKSAASASVRADGTSPSDSSTKQGREITASDAQAAPVSAVADAKSLRAAAADARAAASAHTGGGAKATAAGGAEGESRGRGTASVTASGSPARRTAAGNAVRGDHTALRTPLKRLDAAAAASVPKRDDAAAPQPPPPSSAAGAAAAATRAPAAPPVAATTSHTTNEAARNGARKSAKTDVSPLASTLAAEVTINAGGERPPLSGARPPRIGEGALGGVAAALGGAAAGSHVFNQNGVLSTVSQMVSQRPLSALGGGGVGGSAVADAELAMAMSRAAAAGHGVDGDDRSSPRLLSLLSAAHTDGRSRLEDDGRPRGVQRTNSILSLLQGKPTGGLSESPSTDLLGALIHDSDNEKTAHALRGAEGSAAHGGGGGLQANRSDGHLSALPDTLDDAKDLGFELNDDSTWDNPDAAA